MKKFLTIALGFMGLVCVSACARQTQQNKKATPSDTTKQQTQLSEDMQEIYFAGGCFWGTEKLFQSIDGVRDTECGYANGNAEILPDYRRVCKGDTGYREAVRVVYNPHQVSLNQLLTAFFHVIDPTVEKQQGPDIGDQYQTGVYYTDEVSGKVIASFVAQEKQKHPVFAVEIEPLNNYFAAEEYHQNYLNKNPQGYCHIPACQFEEINKIIRSTASAQSSYQRPDSEQLSHKLTELQYEVTQNGATERPFTGKYWDFYEKGIYVDVTTGEPLFSSLDKYESSCGWPSFSAPIKEDHLTFHEDHSYGMERTEVKSNIGDAHLGHVFYGEPESPNGVRYCINSASLQFIPYDEMQEKGYGEWLSLFNKK